MQSCCFMLSLAQQGSCGSGRTSADGGGRSRKPCRVCTSAPGGSCSAAASAAASAAVSPGCCSGNHSCNFSLESSATLSSAYSTSAKPRCTSLTVPANLHQRQEHPLMSLDSWHARRAACVCAPQKARCYCMCDTQPWGARVMFARGSGTGMHSTRHTGSSQHEARK